jgi:hypothetical protein
MILDEVNSFRKSINVKPCKNLIVLVFWRQKNTLIGYIKKTSNLGEVLIIHSFNLKDTDTLIFSRISKMVVNGLL